MTTLIEPREVPLGGLRAMTVRRTLPHRSLRTIGAWCFLDHYAPAPVAESGGMQVARHPHTGLATVSWLFAGEIDHIDSLGTQARVRPGELNLMTAGRGITYSEFSTADTEVLHGVQLWLAMPDHARHDEPRFDHFRPEPFRRQDAELSVFLGRLADAESPVAFPSPIVGAEIRLQAGLELPLDPAFEHGVLVDSGSVSVDGTSVAAHELLHLPTGREAITLTSTEPTRVILIGGTPFAEQIVMWWNFIGRDHDEIVRWRARYQAEMGFEDGPAGDLFGGFPAGTPAPIPAPPLPHTRLRAR